MIAVFIFIAANVLMAWHHSELIADGKPIKHGWWGALYLVFAAAVVWFEKSWQIAAEAALIRKVVFDLSLNLFRGKPLFYVSAKPASIIDKWHNKIFGLNSVPYIVAYTAAAIIIMTCM